MEDRAPNPFSARAWREWYRPFSRKLFLVVLVVLFAKSVGSLLGVFDPPLWLDAAVVVALIATVTYERSRGGM